MTETVNIETKIPPKVVNILQIAGELAAKQGHNLYLVGGVVRDLILGTNISDFDLMVEGDAVQLAKRLAEVTQTELTIHARFKTARVTWTKWSFDLATARSETYDHPGALPRVQPGSLENDLFRRDFTINAMALELNPQRYLQLVDQYGGREDLEKGLVRVLHEKSFTDDATRIWRGIRYEQRLNFQIEKETLKLLQRDVPMLDTISGDRIRHELELVCNEECPHKIIGRAEELGVLAKVHPAFKDGGWLADKIGRARNLTLPNLKLPALYMSLLAYRLTGQECEDLISYLRPNRSTARVLRETHSLAGALGNLDKRNLPPSQVYKLLQGYSLPAIMANYLAGDSYVVNRHLYAFVTRYRFVKPSLTGNSLKKMGIEPGPEMKEMLERLKAAKLDRKVTSRKEEEELVRQWMEGTT
ncbi:MAG: CCA tRNA nucleotidyltransferase [Dehalococcoidales bacterium]|nr:MAG: CCA tRNA nucleotidyltransferase [Dehalococcoidales bacterium]